MLIDHLYPGILRVEIRVVGVAPKAFSREVNGSFLQYPEFQQGSLLVLRLFEPFFLCRGQDFFRQPQIHRPIHLLRVHAHRAL